MSTKYFIYTKKGGYSANDITGCQILTPASYASMIFLLPELKINDYYNGGLIEGNIVEWCKQFCSIDGAFLDIGANTGVYSICLSELCRNVYSFESKKLNYYALCGSVAMSNKENITCFQNNGDSIESLLDPEEKIKFIRIDSECDSVSVIKNSMNLLIKNNYPTLLINTLSTAELIDILEKNLEYRVISVNGYENMYLAVSR